MTGFENHAGLNISSSKLQLVEINYEDEQFRLVNIDEAYFNDPIDLENDKDTKISALLQGAFDELLINKPLKAESISFTLPFELFHVMQVPYDNTLLYQDMIEQFRWEFSVLYPYISTKNLVLQYMEIEKNSFNIMPTSIVFGIQRKYLQMLHNFCRKNNLKLKFIDNLHIAAERALSVCNALIYKGLTLSIYFNNRFLSILYAFNGKPISFKIIPLNDASEIMEHLLRETKPTPSLKIERNQIEAAFICGDEISGSVVRTLNKTLGLDFILFNPFDKIKPASNLFDNKFYLEKYNSFSSAAGIAFRLA
jgi:Tfp pilus assembly PilM family ATPase